MASSFDSFDQRIVEPFPLFNLPNEIIFKILKEYTPVDDKINSLFHIKEFVPFLQEKGLWFRSTLNLHELTTILQPGWHVDYSNMHNWFHVSVNYSDLTFKIQAYSSAKNYVPWTSMPKDIPISFYEIEHAIKMFVNLRHLAKVNLDEILYYDFQERADSKYTCIWIQPNRKLFFWSEYPGVQKMEGGKIFFNERDCPLIFTLLEDFTLQVIRKSKHFNIWFFENIPLLPLSLQPFDTNEKRHRKKIMYKKFSWTFKNVHSKNSSVSYVSTLKERNQPEILHIEKPYSLFFDCITTLENYAHIKFLSNNPKKLSKVMGFDFEN